MTTEAPPTSPPTNIAPASASDTPRQYVRQLRDISPSIDPNRKVVALTFDDGPGPNTPDVLRILQEKRVTATFCVVGNNARANPAMIRQLRDANMGLCNHTLTHDLKLRTRPDDVIARELTEGSTTFRDITGASPTFFRAPGGAVTPAILDQAQRLGSPTLHWTVDPRDWEKPGTDEIVRRVVTDTRPGAIILLHDADGNRSADGRRQTVDALGRIIDELRAQGYEFVDVTELARR